MKVLRGQAKNLRKNIKQNNIKPLLVVFGVLVMITLTYKASNGVMGVGNTMFKEGNKKGRPGQRRRQGFEGREGIPKEPDFGFTGGRKYRTGFREGDCDGTEHFTGGSVGGFQGTSCALNAAPVQSFVGNRKQGFRGKRRRREGLSESEHKIEKHKKEHAELLTEPDISGNQV